jgi:SAM-dependent methyltransferase
MNATLAKLADTYDAAYQHADFLNHLDGFWESVGDTPIKTVNRLAASSFPKDGVLQFADVGCGTGRDLLAFSKLFSQSGFSRAELTGCEISRIAVERCHKRGLTVECSSAESFLDQFSKPFSIIWSHFSLIHLTEDEIASAISLLASKLIPRGILGVGFKAGDGQRLKDPADQTCNVERETTYFKFDLIADLVQRNGLGIQASISIPSSGRPVPHQYAWIIASKL